MCFNNHSRSVVFNLFFLKSIARDLAPDCENILCYYFVIIKNYEDSSYTFQLVLLDTLS